MRRIIEWGVATLAVLLQGILAYLVFGQMFYHFTNLLQRPEIEPSAVVVLLATPTVFSLLVFLQIWICVKKKMNVAIAFLTGFLIQLFTYSMLGVFLGTGY